MQYLDPHYRLMNAVALLSYCQLPIDNGGKVEMREHLEVLRSLGECILLSAATHPIGLGWNSSMRKEIEGCGYRITLLVEAYASRNSQQWEGIAYALLCKGLISYVHGRLSGITGGRGIVR